MGPCSGLRWLPPPPHRASWQQSLGYEARPQSLVVVWNSFFSFVKRGKGTGDGVPPGSGEACRQPQQAGAGGWVGRVLEFPTILFSAGNSKADCPGGRGEGQGPGERDGGQGERGLTLTCKVQLPHKLGCFSKSDIHINTQTQRHAHMRRRLCIPEGGDLGPPAPGSSAAPWGGVGQVSPRGKAACSLRFCPPAPRRL